MNPYNRMIWTLLCALVMWLPAATGVFNDQIQIHIGGIFFVGALLVAYVGVGIVGQISNGYRSTHDQLAHAKRQIEALERAKAAAHKSEDTTKVPTSDEDTPNRRSTDPQ
jgi:hypothetical protein